MQETNILRRVSKVPRFIRQTEEDSSMMSLGKSDQRWRLPTILLCHGGWERRKFQEDGLKCHILRGQVK